MPNRGGQVIEQEFYGIKLVWSTIVRRSTAQLLKTLLLTAFALDACYNTRNMRYRLQARWRKRYHYDSHTDKAWFSGEPLMISFSACGQRYRMR